MTIPTLPTDKTTGDVVDETHIDRTTDGLEYWGEARPNVRVEWVQDSVLLVATNTKTAMDAPMNHVGTPVNIGETFWSNGNPDRLTIQVTGLYDLNVGARWASSATGHRRLGYDLNGGAGRWVSSVPGSGSIAHSGRAAAVPFTATDTLDYVMWQSSGGNLELTSSWWSICLVGVE